MHFSCVKHINKCDKYNNDKNKNKNWPYAFKWIHMQIRRSHNNNNGLWPIY